MTTIIIKVFITSQIMWVPLVEKMKDENICELITITVLTQAWMWWILSFCCYLLYIPVLSFLRHSNKWYGLLSQFTSSWILKLNMQEKGSTPWLPCCLYSRTGTSYRRQQTISFGYLRALSLYLWKSCCSSSSLTGWIITVLSLHAECFWTSLKAKGKAVPVTGRGGQ
jgi:hypothetical protein